VEEERGRAVGVVQSQSLLDLEERALAGRDER